MALSSALKICSGRYPFSSVIFLTALGNSSAASWCGSCFSRYLTFLKPNLFLKFSSHPLMTLNSPALDPSPSFCFESCNDFTFSGIILESIQNAFLIGISYSQKSYLFSTRENGISQKVQQFWACCSNCFTNFLRLSSFYLSLFLQWPLHWIHLPWNVASAAADINPQHLSSNSTLSRNVGALWHGSHGVV